MLNPEIGQAKSDFHQAWFVTNNSDMNLSTKYWGSEPIDRQSVFFLPYDMNRALFLMRMYFHLSNTH